MLIRPVLEYVVTSRHTAELSGPLELIQKRALRIIYGGFNFTNCSYGSFCDKLGILTSSTDSDNSYDKL